MHWVILIETTLAIKFSSSNVLVDIFEKWNLKVNKMIINIKMGNINFYFTIINFG